jgi:hypothetical protein
MCKEEITSEWFQSKEEAKKDEHSVIKFVSDLRQVGGLLRLLQFPALIKLIATI